MYKIFFILTFLIVNNLCGQTNNYLVQIRNQFNGKNEFIISANDTILFKEEITIELSTDSTIEYEIRGPSTILGKCSYSDFIDNKEKLISHYHNMVLYNFSPDDMIIHYEIESYMGKEKSVLFFYYKTAQSDYLPDTLFLLDGTYTLAILSNGIALKNFSFLIQNKRIIKLSN